MTKMPLRGSSWGSLLDGAGSNPLNLSAIKPHQFSKNYSKDANNPMGYEPGFELTKAWNKALNMDGLNGDEDPFK